MEVRFPTPMSHPGDNPHQGMRRRAGPGQLRKVWRDLSHGEGRKREPGGARDTPRDERLLDPQGTWQGFSGHLAFKRSVK